MAISSPLLETSIDGARGVLFNISGGTDLTLFEINEAAEIIHQAADVEANIIFGANIDEELGEEVRVTVIATGFPAAHSISPETRRSSRVIESPASFLDKNDLEIPPSYGENSSIKTNRDDNSRFFSFLTDKNAPSFAKATNYPTSCWYNVEYIIVQQICITIN